MTTRSIWETKAETKTTGKLECLKSETKKAITKLSQPFKHEQSQIYDLWVPKKQMSHTPQVVHKKIDIKEV